MSERHLQFWPPYLPRHMHVPATNLYYNVEVSAARFPDKPFLIFYDTPISFSEFKHETERIAGYLQQRCGVKKGDRVLIYLQNSPQFMLAYYGILRADAVVVPVNPMNLATELRHYVVDSGAKVAFAPQDLHANIGALLGEGLDHLIVACYADYLRRPSDLNPPAFLTAPPAEFDTPGVLRWAEMLEADCRPGACTAGADDLCVMPYTSGTTGQPKGCMHTHRSTMYNTVSGVHWSGGNQDGVLLAVLPFFHVTGMQGSMNGPLFAGATVVLLPRWDRDVAARCIERYRVSAWSVISTMMIDFLANPRLDEYDISSLRRVSGGGAAMPEAVAQKLKSKWGLDYVEGYGMSETMAATHMNPRHRPKQQCLGIPIFDVDARVVDPHSFASLGVNEVGEVVVNGPQVMQGYWNDPLTTQAVFVDIEGKRFLRTGDLARCDEDGYFFMVDRLKRMINAAGYKVWPAEVETLLYQHPAVRQACVIAARDERRGETVKAVVVLNEAFRGKVSAQEIIDWAHANMAAYKSPRIIEFVDALPTSGTGKVQWRELQDANK